MKMVIQDRYLSATAAALLALAAAMAMAPHAAKASALSYSYLSIDDFGAAISPSPGATISISNLAIVSDLASHLNGGNASDNGSSPSLPLDVGLQCVGNCVGIGENVWSQTGNLDMSRADSLIDTSTSADAAAHFQQVSETNLSGPGSGSATTHNGVTAGFSFVVNGGDGATFDLSFVADKHMLAQLTSTPGAAQASTDLHILILDQGGNTVFDWTPNGSLNPDDITGSIGGTEIADDCNLNATVTRTDDSSAGVVDNAACVFHVVSNLFPADALFTFVLDANADTSASLDAFGVPEPAFPGLFGFLSLATGLYLQRRKQA